MGLGWVCVALLEATAYTVLARAIVTGGAPWAVLVAAGAAVLATVLVSRAGYLSGARLAGDLYGGLGAAFATAKLSWFTADNRALAVSLAGQGIPALMGVPAHQLQTLVLSALIPLGVIAGAAVVLGGPAALAIAVLLALGLAIHVLAQRLLASADAGRHEAGAAVTRATLEYVDHLALLRTAAGSAGAVSRLERSWAGQEAQLAGMNRAASLATIASGVATALPLIGVLLAAPLVGAAAPESLLALVLLTGCAARALEPLALAGTQVAELRALVADYAAVAAPPVLPAAPSGQAGATPRGHVIEFEEVSHGPVLRRVSARIEEGDIALVSGPTGSGKSTLLGLLLRFDDPDSGTVSIGGEPLRALPQSVLTDLVAYVPQDPIVFTGTLAENVRIGRSDASDAEVSRAAELAELGGVIGRSPEGIHQAVGQRGESLSGGERQRVAIARALLKRAPVLVLDEATSALDGGTERRIVEAVRSLGRTVVVVSHGDPSGWDPTVVVEIPAPGATPSCAR